MKKLISFLFIACLAGCFGSAPHKSGKENKPLPNFSMLLTDSTTWFHSYEIPNDKPFVLLYFSPFCPYCRAQTKNIIENMNSLKDVHFYYVTNFPASNVRDFIKEFDLLKFPNITVSLDSSSFIRDYYEISAVPYLAIYGKDKKLNKTFIGKMYASQIKEVSQE